MAGLVDPRKVIQIVRGRRPNGRNVSWPRLHRRRSLSFSLSGSGSVSLEFVPPLLVLRGHDVARSKERVLPTELRNWTLTWEANSGASPGPQSESFIIQRRSADELLGVHFRPGGAFPFLEFPSGELRDLHVSITDIWGEQKAAESYCAGFTMPATLRRSFKPWNDG